LTWPPTVPTTAPSSWPITRCRAADAAGALGRPRLAGACSARSSCARVSCRRSGRPIRCSPLSPPPRRARTAALAARLKWPNDVLIAGRKIAGILVESRGVGDAATAVIAIGVGMNLAQRAFPAALAARATSVAIESGRAVARDTMLGALLDAFDAWRARLEGEGMAPVRARWLALADTIGRRVSIDGVSGVAVDLDPDGALVLEGAGRRHRVMAGEVLEETAHAARP
jgi:biotin-(acetyl-CoA carboxylase) ligase